MPIPDFESIMLPLLEAVKDGREHRMLELGNELADHFKLSYEEKLLLKPSGEETLFQNRVRWARLYLKKAGLVEDPRSGYTRITSKGSELLQKNISKIDVKFLKQYPEFSNFYHKKKAISVPEMEVSEAVGTDAIPLTPEDMIIQGYEIIRNNLEKEIISRLINNLPEFFERAILELVRKMGYGIDHQVLGRTGDGGIDGVIKQDKLGLEEIYFQAKRWKGTVPIHQVRDFAGALLAKKSKKGIFITTSDFSPDAHDYVRNTDLKIILINGDELSKLMFENNLGVTTSDTYELKKIDEDYFAE